jgi:hypothetical protein
VKRHPALGPLSCDHHHALVIARRLGHADEGDATEAARAFLAHWDDEEKLHFQIEEEVLLPRTRPTGIPVTPRSFVP